MRNLHADSTHQDLVARHRMYHLLQSYEVHRSVLNRTVSVQYAPGLLDAPTTCVQCHRKFQVWFRRAMRQALGTKSPGWLCALLCRQIGGPIWSRPTSNPEWVSKAIAALNASPKNFASHSRLVGRLAALEQELVDQPLFYHLPSLCHVLHLQTFQMVCVCVCAVCVLGGLSDQTAWASLTILALIQRLHSIDAEQVP